MKRANWIVLVVSIVFIVSGLAFIVSGFQEKTVTAPHLVKAEKTSSESNKGNTDSTNKVSEKKSEAGSSTVNSKLSSSSGTDSARNSGTRSNPESDSRSNSRSNSKTAAHSTSKTQTSVKSSGSNTDQSKASNAEASSSKQEFVSVEIKGYDNKNFSGPITFKDGMTAFRALKTLTDSKNIALDYSGFGSAIYVKSINGQSAGDKSAQSGWTYSVNGKTPNVSAGSYALHSGDKMVWTYQD